MRQKNRNPQKSQPGHNPPVLRELTNDEVKQLNQSGRQNCRHEKALCLVPYPGAKFLVRKLVSVLKIKAVVVESQTEDLADEN